MLRLADRLVKNGVDGWGIRYGDVIGRSMQQGGTQRTSITVQRSRKVAPRCYGPFTAVKLFRKVDPDGCIAAFRRTHLLGIISGSPPYFYR